MKEIHDVLIFKFLKLSFFTFAYLPHFNGILANRLYYIIMRSKILTQEVFDQ